VITESVAKKYFGDVNPIDKILTLDNKNFYRIGGVIKDINFNSHLQIGFLANIESRQNMYKANDNDNWKYRSAKTYVLLKEGEAEVDLNKGIERFSKSHVPEYTNTSFRLKPIED